MGLGSILDQAGHLLLWPGDKHKNQVIPGSASGGAVGLSAASVAGIRIREALFGVPVPFYPVSGKNYHYARIFFRFILYLWL